MVDYDEACRAVQDENADPSLLALIAYENPEFGPNVASHPRAYPGLLAWLARFGDEKTKKIIMERIMTESIPLSPSAFKQEEGPLYTPEQVMEVKDAMIQHDIAQNFPELRKYLAQNPNCYPELLEWFEGLDDPEVQEALQKRKGEASPTL
ncbi:MAG: hypothetical protein IIY17_00815 [Aeriscardovia sp.]|nr:hypothetical protein [Aeriscardovia sp.]MBP5785735.1 hypothetical protein [Aeriscardovia sp.]MBQ1286517.1 hypothetical protein [Aeriscardovia sp.]MBQ1301695.1 hypothetical protein [Aeriscardovia sp.]MBQ1357128.1 hypothetical protein [Aeriscardovia sp.]